MTLTDATMKDLANVTADRIKAILADTVAFASFTKNFSNGTVTLEGDTYTCSANQLRLMGFCAVCGQEVMSKPIRRLADIADQKRAFRPEKHECMDI
jgi:hypothetical protein